MITYQLILKDTPDGNYQSTKKATTAMILPRVGELIEVGETRDKEHPDFRPGGRYYEVDYIIHSGKGGNIPVEVLASITDPVKEK